MPYKQYPGSPPGARPLLGKLSGFPACAGVWAIWHYVTVTAWWQYPPLALASGAVMVTVGNWWFQNDEPSAQGNTFVYKYIRNPMQNFRWYVIGVEDRPHLFWGWPRADINQRSDMDPPQVGWVLGCVWLAGLPLLPYASYSSPRITFQLGWQPGGGFSPKLNFSNSAYQ